MPTHNGDEKSLLVPLPALLKEARAAAVGKLAEAQVHKLAEAQVREAAARIARVDKLRLRVSGAIERQLVAAEQRAEAERQGFALSLAEERLLDAQSTAEASEAAAADAEVQMIRTGIYMELESLFGQEEAARFLVLAAHRTALSTEADSGGSKRGSLPGAKPGSTRSGPPSPPKRPQDARSIRGLDALHESPTPKEVVGPSGKLYASTSLGCCMLQPGHFPRSRCILVVESRLFDPVILLTILANCATMAWESPLDLCCTPKAECVPLAALPLQSWPNPPTTSRHLPPPTTSHHFPPPPTFSHHLPPSPWLGDLASQLPRKERVGLLDHLHLRAHSQDLGVRLHWPPGGVYP